VAEDTNQTRLDRYKEVTKKWLYITNDDYIDVIFGVIFANRLDTDPVWLYLVAPPSAGKTEIVGGLEGHPEVYLLSTMTEKALISGYVDESQPKDSIQEDPSLLPRLNKKVLIIKDFTAILDMQPKIRREILGQFRDAFDGSAKRTFGTGKDTTYHSKFGVIAATTGAIDKFMIGLADLGERFITYRLPIVGSEERLERAKKAMTAGSATERKREMSAAAHFVLNRDTKNIEIPVPEELQVEIFNMADVVAYARTHISRERGRGCVTQMPEPEVPTRICKQLLAFGRGLAIAREKDEIGEGEISLMRQVSWGCIPTVRRAVLHALVEKHPGKAGTVELSKLAGLPQRTTARTLEDMTILGLVGREKGDFKPGSGAAESRWFLADSKAAYLAESGI
jgi:hypothetical protein